MTGQNKPIRLKPIHMNTPTCAAVESRRMKLSLGILLLALTAGGGGASLRAQTIPGSQLPVKDNACIECHAKADFWTGEQKWLYVSADSLSTDVHALAGVNCHDCHGGDPHTANADKAHATNVVPGGDVRVFIRPLSAVRNGCANCHRAQALNVRKSVHVHAGEKNADGSRPLLGCGKCHGEKAHGMLPVTDSRSPVFLDHQVTTCGGCHENELETYMTTVHAHGLYRSGLLVAAVCADCHGAHGIFYAADERSTLHSSRVATTCGKCHKSVAERLRKSIHGSDHGSGHKVLQNKAETAPKTAPKAATTASPADAAATVANDYEPRRNPSCTDCHLGHELLDPSGSAFRLELSNRCGNCHLQLTGRYAISMHGELTRLGYAAAADCADCHGSHQILSVTDPRPPLATAQGRLGVCRQCHIHAVANFSQMDPHANYQDARDYPWLHGIYVGIRGLFYFFFAFFLIHSFLWFVRSFVQAISSGRHETLVAGESTLVRYEPVERVLYAALFTSFLGLILTGLTLKHSAQPWAKSLARESNGFQSIAVWHFFFATVAIVGCVTHMVRGIGKIRARRREKVAWRTIVFGPDSRVPNAKDARDMLGMVRWFFGLGQRPSFERWSYWEKFDYWAVYLTAIVVGGSGLLLWYPNIFCRFLPGSMLNVAKVLHSEISILAAALLFMFHFYNTHFRPEKFPLDLSALTGMASERHLRRYRAQFVDRLRARASWTNSAARRRRNVDSGSYSWPALVFTVGLGLMVLVLVTTLG